MAKGEKELVIHCPGTSHTEAQVRVTCPTCQKVMVLHGEGRDKIACSACRRMLYRTDGESHPATPKILLIAKAGSVGRFKIQCNSNRCKHSRGSDYNGWYDIHLKASGTYSIELLPKQHFAIRTAPAVVLDGER